LSWVSALSIPIHIEEPESLLSVFFLSFFTPSLVLLGVGNAYTTILEDNED
jgi:hypothetical protein